VDAAFRIQAVNAGRSRSLVAFFSTQPATAEAAEAAEPDGKKKKQSNKKQKGDKGGGGGGEKGDKGEKEENAPNGFVRQVGGPTGTAQDTTGRSAPDLLSE
jgi:hypothetical protein